MQCLKAARCSYGGRTRTHASRPSYTVQTARKKARKAGKKVRQETEEAEDSVAPSLEIFLGAPLDILGEVSCAAVAKPSPSRLTLLRVSDLLPPRSSRPRQARSYLQALPLAPPLSFESLHLACCSSLRQPPSARGTQRDQLRPFAQRNDVHGKRSCSQRVEKHADPRAQECGSDHHSVTPDYILRTRHCMPCRKQLYVCNPTFFDRQPHADSAITYAVSPLAVTSSSSARPTLARSSAWLLLKVRGLVRQLEKNSDTLTLSSSSARYAVLEV